MCKEAINLSLSILDMLIHWERKKSATNSFIGKVQVIIFTVINWYPHQYLFFNPLIENQNKIKEQTYYFQSVMKYFSTGPWGTFCGSPFLKWHPYWKDYRSKEKQHIFFLSSIDILGIMLRFWADPKDMLAKINWEKVKIRTMVYSWVRNYPSGKSEGSALLHDLVWGQCLPSTLLWLLSKKKKKTLHIVRKHFQASHRLLEFTLFSRNKENTNINKTKFLISQISEFYHTPCKKSKCYYFILLEETLVTPGV